MTATPRYFPSYPESFISEHTHSAAGNPIPPQFREKRKRRRTDANANFSGPPSAKEGERKELDESTSASIIQHE